MAGTGFNEAMLRNLIISVKKHCTDCQRNHIGNRASCCSLIELALCNGYLIAIQLSIYKLSTTNCCDLAGSGIQFD